ncbi:MAG: lipid-A-disaccharide synthase N-terminal domain-containing protein [Planctomycetota bacterium]|jgi:lipid-A-disaccharide synthase-like uncharacterized protein
MIAIELLGVASEATGSARSVLDPLLEWFRMEDPWRKWLIGFGFLGQTVFFFRWIIQWMASERRGRSHVPELFWWCSLVGALMLFTYFVLDRDPVGMVGQGVGWTVYSRNLYLIRFKRRTPSDEPA